MSERIVITPYYTADAYNQYGRRLVTGTGPTPALAAEDARNQARDYIKYHTNPNWGWRIARIAVNNTPNHQ